MDLCEWTIYGKVVAIKSGHCLTPVLGQDHTHGWLKFLPPEAFKRLWKYRQLVVLRWNCQVIYTRKLINISIFLCAPSRSWVNLVKDWIPSECIRVLRMQRTNSADSLDSRWGIQGPFVKQSSYLTLLSIGKRVALSVAKFHGWSFFTCFCVCHFVMVHFNFRCFPVLMTWQHGFTMVLPTVLGLALRHESFYRPSK